MKQNNHIPDDTKMVSGVKDSLTTQQEQGDLESGFFSREAMAAHSDGHVHLKQEQGEPVALVTKVKIGGILEGMLRKGVDAESLIGAKLYTTPQQRKPPTQDLDAPLTLNGIPLYPQRTWVGLTDEEILELNFDGEFCTLCDDDEAILDFTKAIEAKLRSKNT